MSTASSWSPAAAVDDVLAAGRARAENERALFAALRDGATTVEQFGLDTRLIDAPDAPPPGQWFV